VRIWNINDEFNLKKSRLCALSDVPLRIQSLFIWRQPHFAHRRLVCIWNVLASIVDPQTGYLNSIRKVLRQYLKISHDRLLSHLLFHHLLSSRHRSIVKLGNRLFVEPTSRSKAGYLHWDLKLCCRQMLGWPLPQPLASLTTSKLSPNNQLPFS
jgi:hypothetical protein